MKVIQATCKPVKREVKALSIRDLLLGEKSKKTDLGKIKGGNNALDSVSVCPICNKPMMAVTNYADWSDDERMFKRTFNSFICREHRVNLPEV
jgi:hypothetical protein